VLVTVQRDGVEQRLTVEEFEAAVVRGDVPEELPVATGGAWIRAADWPTWASLRTSTAAQLHGLWRDRRVPWLTAVIVGGLLQISLFSGLLFARGWLPSLQWLARDTTGILERGEGWRLVTYALLHDGPVHILSNGAALLVACYGLERLIGRAATGMVLLASVLIGGVASATLLPGIASVGVSGGDFGVLGACAVLSVRFLDFVPRGSRAAFGLGAAVLTLQFLLSGVGQERVDNPCHFGGLAAGVLLGLAYRPAIAAWARWNAGVTALTAAVCAALILAPTVAGERLVPTTPWEGDGGHATRPAWWTMQVGKGGLGGFGNADRSSTVSIDTSRQGAVKTVDEALGDILATVQRFDPGAVLEREGGDRGAVRYTADGEARIIRLRVVVRGLYTTVAAVDVAQGGRMEARLVADVLDGLVLDTPPDLADALAGKDSASARARLEAAVAAAELGAPDRSAAAFAAERARGDAARVDIAELTVLAALGDPLATARIDAALAAWPDDRRVKAAAARALHVVGEAARAEAFARELLATADGERARRSAAALLDEIGGTAAP
jgi:membrane associated rhomboid family serine protease